MIQKLKIFILSVPLFRQLYELNFVPLDLIYKPEDLTADYYSKIKNEGDIELEHQIGRITNYKKILTEIAEKKLPGDIVEFGSWKGFSLLWFGFLAERLGLFRKIIGLDGFIGLPSDDGEFSKGAFSNTNLKSVRKSIASNNNLYDITKKNIFVDQVLFNDRERLNSILNSRGLKKCVLIHIDCDVSSSAQDIFDFFSDGTLLSNTCFVLFDDYGCDSNLKNVVDEFIVKMSKQWIIEVHSFTKLTKNFKFTQR